MVALPQSDPFGTLLGSYNPQILYRLNETSGPTAYDQSGNGNNGTYDAATVFGGKPLTNALGASVKGAGNVAVVSASTITLAAPFSFIVAAKFNSFSGASGLGYCASGNTGARISALSSAALQFSVGYGTNVTNSTPNVPGGINLNESLLIVCTLSGTAMATYLNGLANATSASVLGGTYSPATVMPDLGIQSAEANDFAILPVALTSQQVAALYNAWLTPPAAIAGGGQSGKPFFPG